MKRILDAKYSKADIKTVAEISTHIDPQERNELYTLLKKYACLFDGNLGTWNVKPYDIKLKLDAEPYHGKPFPGPRIHELTFKQELDINSETKIMKRILDAKYSKADIKTIAESSTHLDLQERNELYTLMKKYECLFDGNLGT